MSIIFEKFNYYLGLIALGVYLLMYMVFGQGVLNKDENMLFIMVAHVHFPLTFIFLCFGKEGSRWVQNIFQTRRLETIIFFVSFLIVFVSYFYRGYLKSQPNLLYAYFIVFSLALIGFTALHLGRQTLGVSNLLYDTRFKFKKEFDLFFVFTYVFNNTLAGYTLLEKNSPTAQMVLSYAVPIAITYFFVRMAVVAYYTRNIHKLIFETRFFFFMIFPTSLLAAGMAGCIHSLEYVFIHYNLHKKSGWSKGDKIKTYLTASSIIMGIYLFMVLVRTGYIFLTPELLNIITTTVVTYNTMHIIIDWALFSNYFSISKLLIRPLLKD